MKLYLAGPMRGLPRKNRRVFSLYASHLRSQGHVVWVPTEHALMGNNYRAAMSRDIPAMLAQDAVVVLPGWLRSKGARMEVFVAVGCGVPIYGLSELWALYRLRLSRVRSMLGVGRFPK